MSKLRYLIVGSGWRSLFYVRIAQALPEHFEVCAMLCRTPEKAARMRPYGIRTSCSAEECAAMKPDFIVVAASKASLADISREWLARGFAVLCETPAALDVDTLRALWALHQQGARLQIAEQYWRYPSLAAQLAAVQSGMLGTPAFARLSVAHGYHAASLSRLFLNAGQQSVTITGRAWPVKIIETDSRWGKIEHGPLAEKILQRHTLEFSGGGAAFLDFCNVQYHSFLRSTHINIQGERGELDGQTVRYLDAAGDPVCATLKQLGFAKTPFAGSGLSEDETAIACLLDGMGQYLAAGQEVYPLADALQDAYLSLLMEQALEIPGQPIHSAPQPWNIPENPL
ncbi:MAG: Gfo/Idh/MocA family protein [Faecalibacterium sp.]